MRYREITLVEFLANPIHSYLIADLQLSTRAMRACVNNDWLYVGEIAQETEAALIRRVMHVPYVGQKTVEELKSVLEKNDATLNTRIVDVLEISTVRVALGAIRHQREQGLSELQRLAAPEAAHTNNQHPKAFLKAAKSLLTPSILEMLKDEHQRTVIAGCTQTPPVSLRELGKILPNLSYARIGQIRDEAVQTLKRAIRAELVPGNRS